ncbi:hypothetical protein ASG25_11525 [Rhizobium sp. Leaf384]|jgi:hypothetical protein|uniref:hypothetical protein n=1 Tax=unclassified Rhizobium TaxID=2613769 RepID=UPI00071409EF|nr:MULTISPECIES: hypothetical protein [unclassified Rhizobium]KQR68781.1 hypothetical protein ASG03_05840 [Rhizobium sp. Leaf341]KQS79192.1 hypothetical protein ASG25_11525 [Rhizobium sp. Leaf384]KQS82760.1 hypothetical protein ASG58_05340 [Rhizobium sp. Leaf383]
MKKQALAIVAAALFGLTACTTEGTASGTSGNAVEPIPGSITYRGQPTTRLTKSPIGSTFPHRFRAPDGREWQETYRVAPDRSLELISRRQIELDIDNNR